jgi:MYXO-CTERM domain-containing protein
MRVVSSSSVVSRAFVARVVVVVALAVGGASSSRAQPAQSGDVPGVDDCSFFLPTLPTPDSFPEDAPPGSPPDQPAFGSVMLVAPPPGAGPVPRNVEIVLGGNLVELEQGFWDLWIDGPSGRVAFGLDGARVVPDGGLLPAGVVQITLQPSATLPCQGCFPPAVLTLEVTDVVDLTPPVFTDVVIHELVPPSFEQQAACNAFIGTVDFLAVALTTDEDAFAAVAARHALVEPRIVLQFGHMRAGSRTALLGNLAQTPVVAEGDDVVVVAFARDLAGNASPPLVTRVRARSMSSVPDAGTTIDELAELRCALDAVPAVSVPSRLPRNPSLRVVFPFEDVPIVLRRGDEVVAVVPGADVVEDARTGRLFSPVQPVAPGVWELVSLPCERCVCPQCTLPLRVPLVIDDVVDVQVPSAPRVRTLLDDALPPRSEGRCGPDRAALLAVLAPGEDDVSGAHDLVYDVSVRVGADPPRPMGIGLSPLRRADGDVVLRLPTAPFGRIVDRALTLDVTARDAAGNASTATWSQAEDDDGQSGCGTTGAGTALALAGLALRRRRRR